MEKQLEITGIHPVIRTKHSLTRLLEDTENSDRKELEEILIQGGICNTEIGPLPDTTEEVFKTLDEWRQNIQNIVLTLENFGIDKYNNDAKRQSKKFVARTKEILEGISEYGEQFDLSRSLVSVRTETKMLDLDRNKIFNLLTEFCAKFTIPGKQFSGGEEKVYENPRVEIKPSDDEKDRVKKENITLEDGSEYTGEWKNGEPDGQGTKLWPPHDADSNLKPSKYRVEYQGEFAYGRAHGYGKCTYANGDIYEGDWENDEKHGSGQQTNKKGIVLTGKWINGTLEGKGTEKWPNEDVYQGDFALGKKHGTGTFKFYDGSQYTGEFKENSINGYGTYIWSDGRRYEGYFKNNKMEGIGKYTWPQGESYEGEYKNDKRHGKGRFKWPDGRIYDGYFEDGKKNGQATYTDKKGDRKIGQWENGKHVKWLS